MECRAIDEQERKTGDGDGRRRLIFETALLQRRRHYGVKGSRVGRGRDAENTAGWCGRWLRRGS